MWNTIFLTMALSAHNSNPWLQKEPPDIDHCNRKLWEGSCNPALFTKMISIIWGVLAVVYFIIYMYYNSRARMRLDKLPYNRFRTGNLLQNWQIVVTGAMVANSLFMFPMPAAKAHPGVQAILQGFSWTEAGRQADLAQRNLLLGLHVKDVKKQPMFCLETAVKLLTFTWVVYGDSTPPSVEKDIHIEIKGLQSEKHQSVVPVPERDAEGCDVERGCNIPSNCGSPAECGELTEEELLIVALNLYGLQHTHVIHEKDPDTKVLIAWSGDTIVVAFRGTASLRNVLHDLQAWPADHMPKRGRRWLGRRPLVHKGFWRSWSAQSVGDRVVMFLAQLLADSKLAPADWHVYITGHSLGGALATLAAYDIQTAFGFKDLQVYTYGAPRTGNHAFAREYEQLIPETWHIVHDADVVPRMGKFFRMYNRPGARVIIDRKGSIVVRPSPLELHLWPTRQSLKAHFLKSYQCALAGVLRAQFCPLKAFVDGRHGALGLADDFHLSTYLRSTCLDMIALNEADGSASDATDLDTAAHGAGDQRSRMPAWAHALVDQVVGTALEDNLVRTVQMTRGPGDDHNLVTGNIQSSTCSLQTGA
ncbi:hypothetical protein WJX75_001237 [Coccomyxa subellipsoidea]|uniref:Fungal lipase-type domain-containing protein n=1 Tax=Coccomyxa subellipsoidea TaxID=248742 RepID=A0ABR2YIY0_9CHLO